MIILKMAHLPDKNDLGGPSDSVTLLGDDTVVYFKGKLVNWEIPLKLIKTMEVRIEEGEFKL